MVAWELLLENILYFSTFELPFQEEHDQDKNICSITTLPWVVVTVTGRRCIVELHFNTHTVCSIIPLNGMNWGIIPVDICYDPFLWKGRS